VALEQVGHDFDRRIGGGGAFEPYPDQLHAE